MGGLVRRDVEFAVPDAAAGAHPLHVAGRNGGAVAHAVLVGQCAGGDIGDDLHVAVRVRAEAAARRDQVVVDDAQVAPAHVRRIEIVGERERVMTFQPAVVGMAALLGFANGQHGRGSLG